MDSRTRTFLALERQPADRIPTDFWASGAMIRRIEAEEGLPYEAFLDRHDIDLRYIPGPCYVGPPLPEGGDIWGVRRRSVDVPTPYGEERYSEVAESPLAGLETPEEIARYAGWPSPDAFDYSVIPAQCRRVREAGRVVCFMGDRLNRVAQLKPAMYLRGIEAILLDLSLRPDLAAAVIERSARSTRPTSIAFWRPPGGSSTSWSPATISAPRTASSSPRAPGASTCGRGSKSTCASSPTTAPARCTTPAGRWWPSSPI